MTLLDLSAPKIEIEAELQKSDPTVGIGIVCCDPGIEQFYTGIVDDRQTDSLVFAVQPDQLPDALTDAGDSVDVVLAIADPDNDMESVPQSVNEVGGGEVVVVLEDIAALYGTALRVSDRRPEVARQFSMTVLPEGFDPFSDAENAITEAHHMVARKNNW